MVRLCESKQNLLAHSRVDETNMSRELLWRYLALVVKQNGKLYPSDIASMLVESAAERQQRLEQKTALVSASTDGGGTDITAGLERMTIGSEEHHDDASASDTHHHRHRPSDDREAELADGVAEDENNVSLSTPQPIPVVTTTSSNIKGSSNDGHHQLQHQQQQQVHALIRSLPQLSPQEIESVYGRLTELVCLGRRREAIELAVSHRLWGHAMAIGSRMEQSVGGRVLTAFMQTLPQGDVVHTLVQQVNGKRPDVTKVRHAMGKL